MKNVETSCRTDEIWADTASRSQLVLVPTKGKSSQRSSVTAGPLDEEESAGENFGLLTAPADLIDAEMVRVPEAWVWCGT